MPLCDGLPAAGSQLPLRLDVGLLHCCAYSPWWLCTSGAPVEHPLKPPQWGRNPFWQCRVSDGGMEPCASLALMVPLSWRVALLEHSGG